jgi:hypothetical protein
LLGADKPRALALTGRVGDGWISLAMNYKTPAGAAVAQAPDRWRRLRRRTRPTPDSPAVTCPECTSAPPTPGRETDEAIVGPPDHWANVLTHFALDLGFSTLWGLPV